jgi:hypothetical protein
VSLALFCLTEFDFFYSAFGVLTLSLQQGISKHKGPVEYRGRLQNVAGTKRQDYALLAFVQSKPWQLRTV